MGELIGKDIGAIGHAGLSFTEGKIVLSGEISLDKIVDLAIDEIEKLIPGDTDKLFLEPARLAAKTAVAALF